MICLFPGDISVVGALGDFVVAGSGCLASRVTDAGKEFRGASFATGQTLQRSKKWLYEVW